MGARNPERHLRSLALLALIMAACLTGAGVQWQYETSSGEASQSQSSAASAGAAYGPSSQITAPAETEAVEESESTDKKGGLWSWGGAPKGFKISNGTLEYPPGYYTPWMGYPDSYYGYTKSGLYPTYNEPKVYHGYSFGFSTGVHPGFSIMGLLYPNDTSGYDPWNNYPGYDPMFPYEIKDNKIYRIYPTGTSIPWGSIA